MNPELSISYILQSLEGLAAQLEIEVRYEALADEEISVQSGGCRVLGRNLIILDDRLALEQQARILARELSRYDLENLYVLPRVREYILIHSASREKNLPQR